MNFKTTIVLILLLLVAGIAVYFVHTAPTTEPPPEQPAKLFDLTSADVSKLTISPADDKQIVFEKKGGAWQILEPFKAPADTFAVDDLVSSLTGLESHGKSDAGGANADVTGLASPKYRIEIVKNDGKTIKLAVGKPTGVGDELYVQKEGDSQADRVAASLYTSLNKPASGFRNLTLLDVKSPEIKSIEITQSTGSLTVNRDGNNWAIGTLPTTMPADESEATDLAMGITGLRANEFVADKSDDLKRYGLDDPQLSVQFTSQPTAAPASTKPSTQPLPTGFVRFGRYQDLRKQNVFVQTSASSAVAIVPASSMTKFQKKPIELRDKNVLRIDKNTVESISITTNKPATTQPTTREASQTMIAIVRNKVTPEPVSEMAQATSQPATAPTTTIASTEPTSGPTTGPTTVASSQPATKPAPPPKWIFADSKSAADETSVDALLNQLSPLRVEKFLEKNPTTKPSDTYTLNVTTVDGSYTIGLTDPGGSQNPIGDYNGLTFEVSRFFLEKLTPKFTPSATPAPAETPAEMPPVSPMPPQ